MPFRLMAALALVASQISATERAELRLYEIVTETGMPHLEESLRYTTTRHRQCLGEPRLLTAFPLLGAPALAGCRLVEESRRQETVTYMLTCDAGNETTGTARWQLATGVSRGTLSVKLGGKNMTVYQRLSATLLPDECDRES